AQHRSAVPEPLRDPGRRCGGCVGGDRIGRDLPERRVPARRVRGRDLLRARRSLLRDRWPPSLGAFTRGGVRAHPRRAGRPGPGSVRGDLGGTGGDPRAWYGGHGTNARVTTTHDTAVRVVPTQLSGCGAAGGSPAAPHP